MFLRYSAQSPEQQQLVRAWVILGVAALAFAGLFSLLLVAARAPIVQEFLPWKDAFRTILSIHVNLSVLVWFVAMGCALAQLVMPHHNRWDAVTFHISAIAVVAVILVPFFTDGQPLLNNYIPIIDTPLFIAAIYLFMGSTGFLALRTAWFAPRRHIPFATRQVAGAGGLYVFSLAGLLLAWWQLSQPGLDFNPAQYYELLFWGGGHMLQFYYTALMLIIWVWLVNLARIKLRYMGWLYLAFFLHTMITLFSLAGFKPYPAYDPGYIGWFTRTMQHGGGVAAIIVALWVLVMIRQRWAAFRRFPLRWMLFCSMFMFLAGGVLGYMIEGVNTVIPAHYHGSIVGVTLALMAAACYILARGDNGLLASQFLTLQPCIYSIGQMMHISGLAWSGGYGALRKTPGAMQSIEGKTAMGLMGLGGLLSVVGGLLFVVICIRLCHTKHHEKQYR